MAQTATIFIITVELADVDRGVYETLELRVARQPSESDEYMVTRVLAYCLEYTEGIAFSKGGISDPDEPAIVVKDLTGAWRAWIEVGAPDAARLHKASKASPRVALWTHREPRTLERLYAGQRIHRADEIRIHYVDTALLDALAARLDRRMSLALTVTDATLFVELGSETLSGTVTTERLPG